MSFGSKRWFPYTDDGGNVWGIFGDESNIELLNTGADSLTVPSGTRKLPQDISQRFVRLKAGDGGTKTVPILTPTIYNAIDTNQAFAAPSVGEENASGTSFVVVQKVPERILRAPTSLDTGKNDGDNP